MGRNPEGAEGEGSREQEHPSTGQTGCMLDAQMGKISWSLLSEKQFEDKDKLKWKPNSDQL